MTLSRRALLGGAAGLAAAAGAPAGAAIRPDWQSLADSYQIPEWFRDAKFGIWAHWGPQCQPEAGDWYGRLMYVEGDSHYDHHLKHYGHPSRTGFIDIIGRWRAENWRPEALVERYRKAGARYFVALANHHDNFDNFDSAHHGWNAVRVGPKRDLIGGWAKAARAAGLRFGVSNHSGHAWHWWQTAYGYDSEGPLRGARYDAYWLRAKHGAGTWWQGLDPQDLYVGPSFVPPDGITSIAAMNAWHDQRDGQWLETAPPARAGFVANWLARQNDLVEKYQPDLVYLDDTGLPFGQAGLEAAAHYYNLSRARSGAIDVVMTAKKLSAAQKKGVVEDVERGFVDGIQEQPWQTCTCIGNWHYDRSIYERHGYRSAKNVVQRLADVVAKNGNLLLSIPVRGDGTIDPDEEAITDQLAGWFAANGEAIHSSRPWRVYGEGPTRPKPGVMNEGEAAPFTSADIRYTSRAGALYAILLDWPSRPSLLSALAAPPEARVERVALLGHGPLEWRRGDKGIEVALPPPADADRVRVPVLRIGGRGLA